MRWERWSVWCWVVPTLTFCDGLLGLNLVTCGLSPRGGRDSRVLFILLMKADFTASQRICPEPRKTLWEGESLWMEGTLFMKGFKISGYKICIFGDASGFFLIDLTTSGITFSRGCRSWEWWAPSTMCAGGRASSRVRAWITASAFLHQPNNSNNSNRNRNVV